MCPWEGKDALRKEGVPSGRERRLRERGCALRKGKMPSGKTMPPWKRKDLWERKDAFGKRKDALGKDDVLLGRERRSQERGCSLGRGKTPSGKRMSPWEGSDALEMREMFLIRGRSP